MGELQPTSECRQMWSSARVVLEALVRHGVSTAFGIPGGLVSPLYDALLDVPRIRASHAPHEGMIA